MKLSEKIRTSYLGSFIIITLIMFLIKLLFGLMDNAKYDYLEMFIMSSVFGLVMSLIVVPLYTKNQRKKLER